MIDFHCHIDLYPDPVALINECDRQGIYILSMTTTPRAWRESLKMIKPARRIRLALGLHPQIAHERLGELGLFEALLFEAGYVGEIGLDGSPELRDHQGAQIRALDAILKACQLGGGRPLSMHSRQAASEVLDALERWPGAGTPILHWFSGTRAELNRAISLGCWFSVGPAMLNSKKGAEIASLLPRNRTLTETDGPFGKINGRPLRPYDVGLAETLLASTWNITVAEVTVMLRQNLRTLTAIHGIA